MHIRFLQRFLSSGETVLQHAAEKAEITKKLRSDEPKPEPDTGFETTAEAAATPKEAAAVTEQAAEVLPETPAPRKRKKLIPVLSASSAVLAAALLIVVPKLTHKQDNHSSVQQTNQTAINYANYISAGWAHTVALRSDGTVAAAGFADEGQCDVSGWTNIGPAK